MAFQKEEEAWINIPGGFLDRFQILWGGLGTFPPPGLPDSHHKPQGLPSDPDHPPLRSSDGRDFKNTSASAASLNDFDPHLLLFTGDVLNHPSLIPSVRDYFAGFTHQAGAFGVGGNVDGLLGLPRFAESAGWGLIEASARTLRVEGSSVSVIGLGISDTSNSTLLRDSLANLNTADFKILLAHYPDALFIAHDKGIDLQLSGHTHGGQVCTPWGPVVTFSRVPKSIAAGGLHRVGDMLVLVSRGLGWEGHVAPASGPSADRRLR
ncbi:MAG: metallophosphoesterase [Elusimicrobia bacterium]|nr:metallophosphoesterase [Elusimicrobiota bacterium]